LRIGVGLKAAVLGLAVALALIAGWTDWRSRRIPNWLTVPGFVIGVLVNVLADGRAGLKTSLLGAGLGLLVLLPFVLLRSLGAGDWKLAGALGAFVGWQVLVDLLNGCGIGDLQTAIQGNAAQHWPATGVDVNSSYAGSGSFAG
jgi:Flp pilus assembly protein protease CpaA